MAKKAKAPEVQTEETTPVKADQGVVVGTDLLNIRKGPSVNDRVLYVIQKDTTVEIVSEPNPEWYEVVTPSGHGYCMQIFVKRT
nr:MAG TPA: SH3 domain protein [Caudoviricetes sp.]